MSNSNYREEDAKYEISNKYERFLKNRKTRKAALFNLRQELKTVELDLRKDTRLHEILDIKARKLIDILDDLEDAMDAGAMKEDKAIPQINKIEKKLHWYDHRVGFLASVIEDDKAYIKVVKEFIQKYEAK